MPDTETAVETLEQSATETVAPTPQSEASEPSESFEDLVSSHTTAVISGDTIEAARLEAIIAAAPKPAEPASTETTETAATETATPAGATPPETATEAAKDPDRIRLNHLPEAEKAQQIAIHALTKTGVSLADATDFVLGRREKTPATEEPPKPKVEAKSDPEIASIEKQIADGRTKLKEIAAKRKELSAEGTLFGDELSALEDEQTETLADIAEVSGHLADAKRQKAEFQRRADEDSRQRESFDSQRDAVAAQVAVKYPEMADHKSVHWMLAAQIAAQIANPGHPDHEKSWAVDAPDYCAEEAAKLLGRKPSGTATPPVQPAAIPGVRIPTVASGAKATAPVIGQMRVEQSEAETLAIIEGRMPYKAQPSRNGIVFNSR